MKNSLLRDERIQTQMKKILIIFASVASLMMLCKPAFADQASWLEGFKVGGYTSAGITIESNHNRSAAVNEISLLTTWNNDSRWHFFSELEVENPLSWNNREQFQAESAHVDIERFYIDYNVSEKLNIRAGRFLTPNSRWNLLHAPPLVWTSTRPVATSRFFPTGTNGIMLFGAIPFKGVAFEYKVFSEVLEDQELEDDELEFDHVNGARFSIKSQSDIGISIISFKEKGDNPGKYSMLGIDFVTHIKGIEISGEAFQRINKKDQDGGSSAYLQTAVPLNNIGLNNWYWVSRIETFQRRDTGSGERWLLGATWRMKPRQLLKFEFTGGHGSLPDSPRGFLASFALFF